MKAGFARIKITPPLGTRMLGFGDRDAAKGCEGVHDDLFVRALYAEHEGESALIIAYDLLFFSRAEGDRFCGALGRRFNLLPRQVLLNCTHTHAGPALGTWGYAGYEPLVDPLYVSQVEQATLEAASRARLGTREVTIWSGTTRTGVPVSRRYLNDQGHADFLPNPGGEVCDALPICLLKDRAGQPVCLMFSISCHPSTIGGWEISADFPGAATRLLDEHLGATASMFLQGCAGDTKAKWIGDGPPDGAGRATWRRASWKDVERVGSCAADEVIAQLTNGLTQHRPRVRSFLRDMPWPLQAPPTRRELETELPRSSGVRRLWLQRQIQRLDRGETLATHAQVLLQAIQLAEGVQLVALEGEPVAGLGKMILEAFRGGGVTFPLGYTNGQGLYLPTERMLSEGGYEVDSAYEYGFPAPLAPGYEAILRAALAEAGQHQPGD